MLRKINRIFWSVMAVVLAVLVVVEWMKQGCGIYSLVAGVTWVVSCCICFGYVLEHMFD